MHETDLRKGKPGEVFLILSEFVEYYLNTSPYSLQLRILMP